jgi:lysophospholipase L1-like esterase
MTKARFVRNLYLPLILTCFSALCAASSPKEKLDIGRICSALQGRLPSNSIGAPVWPLIKEDAAGRVWIAWEDWENERSRIGFGQFQEGIFLNPRQIGRSEGFNFSPDFAFDQTGSPWLIWVFHSGSEDRIYAQDIPSTRRWLLSSGPAFSISGPKILFDRDGSAWAFWNTTGESRGETVFRVFDGKEWSPPRMIPRETTFPCLNPDVAVDGRGIIWVAWSSYDGEDYEIYLIPWDGNKWGKEIRVTDNREGDLFPSLGLDPGGDPVISWRRSSERGHEVRITVFRDGTFSRELKVSPPAGEFILFRLITSQGNAGILWRSPQGLGLTEFSPDIFIRTDRFAAAPQKPCPLFNLSLNENAYIGFGDSITYGYIDRLPARDLGYPPRLDIILNNNFGPTQMINDGLGGEVTSEGLSRINSVIGRDQARYILLMEGTNDVINSYIAMDTSAFNLREMIRKSLDVGLLPAIATIIPRRDWAWPSKYFRDRHFYLNDKIRQASAQFPVPLVDMFAAFNDYPRSDGGLLSLLSNDLKHPSEKGYQFMAETWFAEIRNYPFPPVDIQLRGRSPEGSLRDESGKKILRPSKRPSFRTDPSIGNILVWEDNPKIFDLARIQGYRIYRKRRGIPGGEFRFVALVKDSLKFLEHGRNVIDQYTYVISTLRDDGVEGPGSEPID